MSANIHSDDLTTVDPSATCCWQGARLLQANLRSVLMSRMAYTSYNAFNDRGADTGGEEGGKPAGPPRHRMLPALPDATKNAISVLVKEVSQITEPKHAAKFCSDKAVQASAAAHHLSLHDQWHFRKPRPAHSYTGDADPRSDIVFVDNVDDGGDEDTPRDPVALLEVGKTKKKDHDCNVDVWLKKCGQGIKYLNLMTDQTVIGRKRPAEEMASSSQASYSDTSTQPFPSQKFGKLRLSACTPILFLTFVYSENEHLDESAEESEAVMGNQKSGASDEAKPENDFDSKETGEGSTTSGDDSDRLGMRIACFLVERKPEHDDRDGHVYNNTNVRLALLYRKHVRGSDAISDALFTMLQQIYWFKYARQNSNEQNWKYLGPHCALVTKNGTKRVYRSYDSRPWPIQRSCVVYESPNVHSGGCILVCHDLDNHWDANPQTFYRIFDFKGEVKVISIPFVEGSHIPSTIQQLIDVARHLKHFHDQGFVHGDLRLLNMVFGTTSQLIDYDFGGPVTETSPIYPKRFRTMMMDGNRNGSAGEVITKSSDVYCLTHAFDKVLRREGGKLWYDLLVREDATIEDVITALEKLEQESVGNVHLEPRLSRFLSYNTKLERTRMRNGSGDPWSPQRFAT